MTKRPLLVPPAATPSGGIFFVATMVPALVCAALEVARVHGGIVTSYGADLFGTAWIYVILRLRATRAFPRHWLAWPSSVAAVTMIGGIASEVAQRAKLLAGTYDPLDMVTYALALLGCLAIERIVGPFAIVPRRPADALVSATASAAKLLGIDAETGTLQAGKAADVIEVAGNPLADIHAREHPTFVMKDGKVYLRPKA